MMNNDQLLEITTEIGWKLLKSGAEIYRVEESIRRMLAAYGFPEAEVFSIPSCIIVTKRTCLDPFKTNPRFCT